ncbi:MAG: hypothetical protein ACOVQ3_13065 [Dolichospermum sp.]|jgi:hypothetical protein
MNIQPIEFPLGLGTANQLRVIVSQGIIFYNLSDTSQTTVIQDRTYPYKVLHSGQIVSDNEEINQEQANNLVISLLGVVINEI